MSLTTIVGALLALVARPTPWDRLERLAQRVDQLTRSQAKLIDRIEDLERELDLQRSLTAHWKGEAQRFARASRQQREADQAQRYAMAQQPLQQAQQSAYQSGQLQSPQLVQQAMAQSQQYQALAQTPQDYQGFCNCVPSRAQVWRQHGLVQKLNDNTET